MEFRVLGPLEVLRDGRAIDLRGSKRRAVLALLVLHANEVVRTERLIEEVWGERQPANAAGALQNHISRLRKDLGADVLVTKPWGYVLRAQADEIDLRRFEQLLAEAKPLPARERAARVAEALALWRGSPLADLADEPALAIEIARLSDVRLAALEQRIDADLELGRHEELVPELEALVAEHPLHERLRGQLILALYRSGRQAEALETYRETRRVLIEELGIEPSAELRELERAILRQDPALASSVLPAGAAEIPRPVSSGWRWPRSPLVAGGAVVLLVGAGLTSAVIVTHGKATPAQETLAGPASTSPVTTRVVTHVRAVRRKQQPTGPQRSVPATVSRRTTPRLQPRSARSRPSRRPKRVVPAHTTTSKAAQPKAAGPFVFNDQFGIADFNAVYWHRAFNGTGAELAQRNGRLEIGLAADAAGDGPNNIVEGHYGTNCTFKGDFDVRVEFRLLTWPAGSGARLTLAAWRATAASASVSRYTAPSEDGYVADLPQKRLLGGVTSIKQATADDAGALRLRRRGDFLTSYYRQAGKWEALGGGPYLGNVLIALQLSAGGDFSHEAVRGAFDNFSVQAVGVACPKS